jgi:hypothetical protein
MAMERSLQEILERLSAGQQEMNEMGARTEARHERIEAAMHSIPSDIDRSVQKQVEDVLSF